MKNKLLLFSFIAIITVTSAHFLAMSFYLYWTFWWFDNVTHFLGGLSMGLFWFFVFQKIYRFKAEPKFAGVVLIVVSIVLVIGIGWEIFEYMFDIATPSRGETYWQDTSYDLISDVVGALAASLIIYKNKLYSFTLLPR